MLVLFLIQEKMRGLREGKISQHFNTGDFFETGIPEEYKETLYPDSPLVLTDTMHQHRNNITLMDGLQKLI